MRKNLESRIETLEKRTRLLLGALLVTTSLAFLGAAPSAEPEDRTVRATRFELVDTEGRVRGELSLREGAPVFSLLDETGRDRLSLNHDAGGTALFIRDEGGVIRLGAAHFAHGGGGFALHGPDSKGAAVLYYDEAGSLSFYDPDGKRALRLPEASE
ncbi:MAG: hypothetical protein GWP16_03240 [Nitrospirae bacterium]|nr:hypothetical protein [Nitrospirota bacterium]